ncbi:hypothetical protein H8I91_21485 [Serratia fonticola]|uniref:hypothetical protein n=1 Tax=Serratia fonticola TaxID=47917 RepID=UPI00164487EA|nr:hypothetical protein [Serratia fonticola]MBC3252841.1 hypothetical protein [Serratia fonticola]
MKKQWVFAAALLAFSASAMAVDGYKNLKFGMSEKDVMETKTCSFRKIPTNEKGFDEYYCSNFKFGDKKKKASVFFINGEFLRIGIEQSPDDFESLFTSLTAKYGEPSSRPTKSDLDALQKIPGSQAAVGFDKDTVNLLFTTDEDDMSQHLAIVYTDSNYEKKYVALKSSAIKSDI